MGATHQTPPSSSALADLQQSTVEVDSAQQLIDRAREIAPIIREHAGAAERERRLPKPVYHVLETAGFQRMLTPRSLGGLEIDPVTCARVVEEIAASDSAAAWSLQVPNLTGWWGSRLSERAVEEVFGSTPSAMMAAAFHPPQQAIEVPGGYRLTARAPLASNIHDSRWVLLTAFIMDDGKPRTTEFGPVMIALMLPTSDIEIIDTWQTLGMRGTDSCDVACSNVFVPAHHTFALSPELERGRHFQGPLYRFPAGAATTLFVAPTLLATARGAVSEFRALATRKTPFGSMKTLRDRGHVQSTLAEAEGVLRSARAFFYEAVSDAWARTAAGIPNTLEQRADLMLAAIHAARSAATVTDTMHRLAGTTGIYTTSPLERQLRDALTLRHHGFVSESKLETVGQIYLGLPPEFQLIHF
jgi:indole-3-acetate monooxygenase